MKAKRDVDIKHKKRKREEMIDDKQTVLDKDKNIIDMLRR